MTSAMPELIFVTGPQQGERAVLMTSTAVLGRSPSAEVRLAEEAASREHVRFLFTRDGWVMENLSANGTLVNGKRYKKDKKILLDTGDVMAIGLETKILYISPGDDPEEALQAWRGANQPAEEKKAAKAAPPAVPAPAAKSPAPAAEPAKAAAGPAGQKPPPVPAVKRRSVGRGNQTAPELADQAAAEEVAEGAKEKGSKTLKLILLCVVMLGIVGIGVALMLREEGPASAAGGGLSRLTAEQISSALEEPFDRPPSPAQAQISLQAAVNSYTNKELWSTGDLFKCVRQFKLYMAYSQSPSWPKVQYERMYNMASRELNAMVLKRYEDAWKYEKALSFRRSKETFEMLMRELPEVERDSLIDRVILKDIKEHIMYANNQLGKKR